MHFEWSLNVPNAARMSRMRLECSSNVPNESQMRLECSSNVPNAAWMQFECPDCRSNSARMQFKCPDQDARMHLECISNAAGIYFHILGT